jgi:hypothetical protein
MGTPSHGRRLGGALRWGGELKDTFSGGHEALIAAVDMGTSEEVDQLALCSGWPLALCRVALQLTPKDRTR